MDVLASALESISSAEKTGRQAILTLQSPRLVPHGDDEACYTGESEITEENRTGKISVNFTGRLDEQDQPWIGCSAQRPREMAG